MLFLYSTLEKIDSNEVLALTSVFHSLEVLHEGFLQFQDNMFFYFKDCHLLGYVRNNLHTATLRVIFIHAATKRRNRQTLP